MMTIIMRDSFGNMVLIIYHNRGSKTYRKGNSYNTASVAEGYQTASIGGYGSHAEGRYTTAQGQASHAEGWGTWASVAYQHAVGKWNATGNFAEVGF